MRAIILAGGYAKRLWPLTKEIPKPLLKVGNKEIITRIIEKLDKINAIDDIIISTNARFEEKFREYVKSLNCKKEVSINKRVTLFVEPTMAEGEKLGSVGGLNFLIENLKPNCDVLIIGGDNIFEFNLHDFIEYHLKHKASVIALKKLNTIEDLSNYGICILDGRLEQRDRIIDFHEKPEKPKSNLVSTACYIFKLEDFLLIKKYLEEGNSPDAVGSFVSWLIRKTSVNGFVFNEDWYDIGSFEWLEEARSLYANR